MLDPKLREILTTGGDGALTIVTNGPGGPHLVNRRNSYVLIEGDELLIRGPAFSAIRKQFSWARAALVIRVEQSTQTL